MLTKTITSTLASEGIGKGTTWIHLPLLTDRYAANRISPDGILARATSSTIIDHNDRTRNILDNEFPFYGSRRVENLATGLVTETIALLAEYDYQVCIKGDNAATAVMSGAFTGTLTADGINRITFPNGADKIATDISVTITVTGTLTELQVEKVTEQSVRLPAEFIPLNDSANSVTDIPVRYFPYLNGNTVDANGVVTEARGADIIVEGLVVSDAATSGGDADDVQVVWPEGLVNDFVLLCEWTPISDISCTIMESGDIAISYVSGVITLAVGSVTATIAYTFVADVTVSVRARLSRTQGKDIFAATSKGTGDIDTTDAVPSAILQLGSKEDITAHINGGIRHVKVVNGDLTDEDVYLINPPSIPIKANTALQSTWRVLAGETVHLPLKSTGVYNFVADWGDGSTDTITAWNQAEATHTYATGGDMLVSCHGLLTEWETKVSTTLDRIVSINNIGETGLTTMNSFARSNYADPMLLLESVISTNSDTAAVTNFGRFIDDSNTNIDINGLIINPNANAVNAFAYSNGQTLSLQNITIEGKGPNDSSLDAFIGNSGNMTDAYCSNFTFTDGQRWAHFASGNSSLTNFTGDIFEVNKPGNMFSVFNSCTLLDLDISNWDASLITSCSDLMAGTSFSTVNYDKMLIAWQAKPHQLEVEFHAGTAQYSAGAATIARDALIAEGWAFIDGGPAPITAKSVIFDIAGNWGDGSFLGVRAIEFVMNGTTIALTASDFTAYATSTYGGSNLPEYVFDTSISKTGSTTGTNWYAGSTTINQRLIVVFNTSQDFNEIIINNSHVSGSFTTRGAKSTIITSSTDAITDTTYNAVIANSTVLNNEIWPQHTAVNAIDDKTVWPLS